MSSYIVFINKQLVSDVLLVYKVLLGYEEALWPKELKINHASQILKNDCQIFFQCTYVSKVCMVHHMSLTILSSQGWGQTKIASKINKWIFEISIYWFSTFIWGSKCSWHFQFFTEDSLHGFKVVRKFQWIQFDFSLIIFTVVIK